MDTYVKANAALHKYCVLNVFCYNCFR